MVVKLGRKLDGGQAVLKGRAKVAKWDVTKAAYQELYLELIRVCQQAEWKDAKQASILVVWSANCSDDCLVALMEKLWDLKRVVWMVYWWVAQWANMKEDQKVDCWEVQLVTQMVVQQDEQKV